MDTPTILKFSHYLPTCLWRWSRQCSETSVYKLQTPGNYPEENIQHTEHGESLKSRSQLNCMTYTWCCVYSLELLIINGKRPKHAEWYSIGSKIVHLVGFTMDTQVRYIALKHEYSRELFDTIKWLNILKVYAVRSILILFPWLRINKMWQKTIKTFSSERIQWEIRH
jgi:hypothetical protein